MKNRNKCARHIKCTEHRKTKHKASSLCKNDGRRKQSTDSVANKRECSSLIVTLFYSLC